MKYSGSSASDEPMLHLIENSERSDPDTIGMSPNQLRDTSKCWLNLQDYALAFGLYYFVKKRYLDPSTFTWLPENRLPGGEVAYGFWLPDNRVVKFSWWDADFEGGDGGARLAINCSLKS